MSVGSSAVSKCPPHAVSTDKWSADGCRSQMNKKAVGWRVGVVKSRDGWQHLESISCGRRSGDPVWEKKREDMYGCSKAAKNWQKIKGKGKHVEQKSWTRDEKRESCIGDANTQAHTMYTYCLCLVCDPHHSHVQTHAQAQLVPLHSVYALNAHRQMAADLQGGRLWSCVRTL